MTQQSYASALLEEHQTLVKEIKVVLADQGYSSDKFALTVWLMLQSRAEVIERKDNTFEVLPKRWVVEHTFGWLNWYRRLSKDYERHPEMSEAAIHAVMIRIMLRRLSA